MANELTFDAAVTKSYISQYLNQGVVFKNFSGVAANGTATAIEAAGAASTKHIIYSILVDVDTAGETLAIDLGTPVFTLRFPVADFYHIKFDPPLECDAAAAITLDKGTTAGIAGRIYYVVAATSGRPLV